MTGVLGRLTGFFLKVVGLLGCIVLFVIVCLRLMSGGGGGMGSELTMHSGRGFLLMFLIA